MDKPYILIVEDKHVEARVLEASLFYGGGYRTSIAYDGVEALKLAQELRPDLILLDLRMPRLDGKEVIRRLRAVGNNVRIIVLSRHLYKAENEVAVLDLGADDCITKPFRPSVVLARVAAQLRRKEALFKPELAETLSFADVAVHLPSRITKRGASELTLTPKEYDLLVLFLQHPRQVLTRGLILEHVWGFEFDGESNAVDVYVGYLRAKLEACGPRLIHTVRGVGYVLREAKPGE